MGIVKDLLKSIEEASRDMFLWGEFDKLRGPKKLPDLKPYKSLDDIGGVAEVGVLSSYRRQTDRTPLGKKELKDINLLVKSYNDEKNSRGSDIYDAYTKAGGTLDDVKFRNLLDDILKDQGIKK